MRVLRRYFSADARPAAEGATCAAAWRSFAESHSDGGGGDYGSSLLPHYYRPIALSLVLFASVWINALQPLLDEAGTLQVTTGAVFAALATAMLAVVVLQRKVTPRVLGAALALLCVNVIVMDMLHAPGRTRTWVCLMILADLAVVAGAPQQLRTALSCLTCLWVVVVEAESVVRFGLFDYPMGTSYAARREAAMCALPPCATNDWLGGVVTAATYCAVFLANTAMMRGLSDAGDAAHARTHATAAAAQQVLDCLAAFDLDAARNHLLQHPELPGTLWCALDALIANLQTYRPYLPQAVLPDPATTPQMSESLPPIRSPQVTGARPRAIRVDIDIVEAASRATYSPAIGSISAPATPASRVHVRSPIVKGSPGTRRLDSESLEAESMCSIDTSITAGSYCTDKMTVATGVTPPTHNLLSRDDSATIATVTPRRGGMDPTPVTPRAIVPSLQTTKVAMLCLRPHVAVPECVVDLPTFAKVHELMTAIAVRCVAAGRGVVDTLAGDRVVASFNASRQCLVYAAAAVSSAKLFIAEMQKAMPEVALSGAVAAGWSVVGVLGTSTLRRPAIMGSLPQQLDQMDKYALTSAHPWVTNAHVHVEVGLQHVMRVCLDTVCFDDIKGWVDGEGGDNRERPRRRPNASVLFEIMLGADVPASAPEEWMYAIGEGTAWDDYNEAGRVFHHSGADAALKFIDLHCTREDIKARFRRAAAAARCVDFTLPCAPQRSRVMQHHAAASSGDLVMDHADPRTVHDVHTPILSAGRTSRRQSATTTTIQRTASTSYLDLHVAQPPLPQTFLQQLPMSALHAAARKEDAAF